MIFCLVLPHILTLGDILKTWHISQVFYLKLNKGGLNSFPQDVLILCYNSDEFFLDMEDAATSSSSIWKKVFLLLQMKMYFVCWLYLGMKP